MLLAHVFETATSYFYNLEELVSATLKRWKNMEKSCLLYQTYFGIDNDISVACCGSSLSSYQVQLLIAAGAKEIVVAYDRQFQDIGDDEFRHLTSNLKKINEKYKNDALISFVFDKKMITDYKDSPIDKGKDVFLKLFKERIIL